MGKRKLQRKEGSNMKAIVKNIPADTFLEDNNFGEYFTNWMTKFIGKTISVKPLFNIGHPWYEETTTGDMWIFHRSWLTFPKKKSAKKGKEVI